MKKRADNIIQMVINPQQNEQIIQFDKENVPSSPSVIEDTPPQCNQKWNWTNLLQTRSTNVCQPTVELNAQQCVVANIPRLKNPITRSSNSSSSSSRSSSSSSSSPSSGRRSSSSNSSSYSSNKPNTDAPVPSSGVRRRVAADCKPDYRISPINTDESDADLSDNDPTFSGVSKNNYVVPASRSSSASSRNDVLSVKDVEEQSNNKKSRKRKRNNSTWKQNMAKKLRNSGQVYTSVSKSKRVIPARNMKPVCNCRLKCSDNIGDVDRTSLFENYWNLPDLEVQRSYIRACVTEINPKYKYTNSEKPRMPNNAFYFTVNGGKIRVCKKYFINTLDISDRQIRTVKSKTNVHGTVEPDRRGKHLHRKTIDQELLQWIREHINSIPRIESHYLRATTSKEYISDSKNIKDLWRDFNEKQKDSNLPECPYWMYINTFNKDFNIGFFQPKKDRCETCLSYQIAPSDLKQSLQLDYDKHLIEKDLCRQEKRLDRANINASHICAVYDLQSVMLCPSPAYFYYSSKINCLDLTITELAVLSEQENSAYDDVHCFFWDETQGQRGANEIGSCIFDYLEYLNRTHSGETLHVTFYSDNCAGQNKNKFITCLYSYAVAYFPNIASITHKYLIKGHTQNEADNVHSLIEKEIKKNEKAGPIYTPHQYITLIKSARKSGRPFIVKELHYEFFKNLKQLQEQWAYNFNENLNKQTVKWNDIKVLKFIKNEEFQFHYKNSYTESDFSTINMRNKRKKMLGSLDIQLVPLYQQAIALKDNKKKDLKDLVKKNLIPHYYASFYNSL